MTIALTVIYFLGVVLSFGNLANDYMNMELDKHFGGFASMAVLALLWPGFFIFATGYYLYISFDVWRRSKWQ